MLTDNQKIWLGIVFVLAGIAILIYFVGIQFIINIAVVAGIGIFLGKQIMEPY